MGFLFSLLGGARVYLYLGLAVALWFVYGWGSSIISTYNSNIVLVTKLQRDAALRESRLASKQAVIERQRAAIDASKCKAQIDKLLKDPDLLKKRDVFNPDSGG